ncbi:hypothetical protein GXB81_27495 [Paraburkholderia sp. Ac-20336]|nr:hypothetical protein [Paraburkholderia sp. Ac-20336]
MDHRAARCVFAAKTPWKNATLGAAMLERHHIRSPRIPAAGSAAMNAAPPPRLAGIRAGGLTRFAFPSGFVGQWREKRMCDAAGTALASQVAYRCGDSTD